MEVKKSLTYKDSLTLRQDKVNKTLIIFMQKANEKAIRNRYCYRVLLHDKN